MRVKMSYDSRKGQDKRNNKGKGGSAKARQWRKAQKRLSQTLKQR